MRLTVNRPEAIAEFVAEGMPHIAEAGGFRDYYVIGIEDASGVLVGGIVASHVNSFDAHISARLTRANALTRRMLQSLFDLAFDEMKLSRLTMLIAPANRHARGVAEKLGFVEEGLMRRGYDGVRDAVIYGMTKDECQVMERENGISTNAA